MRLISSRCAWGDPAGGGGTGMWRVHYQHQHRINTHLQWMLNGCLRDHISANTDFGQPLFQLFGQASSRMASHSGVVLGWVPRCGSIVETKDSWWFEWAVASSALNGSIVGAESKKEFGVDLVGFFSEKNAEISQITGVLRFAHLGFHRC